MLYLNGTKLVKEKCNAEGVGFVNVLLDYSGDPVVVGNQQTQFLYYYTTRSGCSMY